MPGVAIVAIPAEDDYVWKISSEKIPHMTLLFLGDKDLGSKEEHIVTFLQHLVSTTMCKFDLTVDYRGVLGSNSADVIFFRKRDVKDLEAARQNMLGDTDILSAYNSTEQFPEWQPHLTLGYPTSPAHEDTRDYPGIHWVQFDKIALWTGDFTGPEFQLKEREWDYGDVAMSSVDDLISEVLAHHGVKGQRWGFRRNRTSEVTVTQVPGKKLRATGGHGRPAHEDAVKAEILRQSVRKSTVKSLSNAELKTLVERMNLEAQYSRLSTPTKGEGRKFIDSQLKQIGQEHVKTLLKPGK